MMNNLCAEIGFMSVNHVGEQLCGDHVALVEQGERSTVLVLADGLGSGVKANILATLTAKIISTMMAAGLRLEDAVETVAATLPVCAERGVAYSTFTVLQLTDNRRAELMQYDNPRAVLFRQGKMLEYDAERVTIGGKEMLRSELLLEEEDLLLLFSDGVEHAGVGKSYNFGWKRTDIAAFMEPFCLVGFPAKALATLLLEETNKLYGGEPGDDATVCAVKVRARRQVNCIIGPPANRDDCTKMMALFFSKAGKHIVCGGTTSGIAAAYLGKPVTTNLSFPDPDIPPTAKLEGADLVTEGVITINRVLRYAKDHLAENAEYHKWNAGRDGASQLARLLFEEATDIDFFVGRAVNPAHQNPDLPIPFNIKMRLVEQLSDCLSRMGKHMKVSYF